MHNDGGFRENLLRASKGINLSTRRYELSIIYATASRVKSANE